MEKGIRRRFIVIRELSTLVFENWNLINENINKDTSKKLLNDYKRKIIPDFRDTIFRLDWVNTIVSCKYCLNILSVLYSKYMQDNIDLINKSYENTKFNSVIDLIKFYIKNSAIRPVYNDKTIIYVWNSDNKTNKKVFLKDLMTKEQIKELDLLTPIESSKKLSSIL